MSEVTPDVKVTIMVDGDNVRFEFHDDEAVIRFMDVEMTPEDFCAVLGRLARVRCKATLRGLDKVGKVRECRDLVFAMPKCGWEERKAVAAKRADEETPEGWEAAHYFGSKDSFFKEDGQEYARTHIKRWVDKLETP